MKILFAAPDRDLLACCEKLLESDGAEVVTAFDGAQTLLLLSNEGFDIAVLDRALPRIPYTALIERLKEKKIPSIVLTDTAVSAGELTGTPLPNAFLPYPFSADDLKRAIGGTLEKAASRTELSVGDAAVDIAGFRFVNGPALTADEIDVLRLLSDGGRVTTAEGAPINALNRKLEGMGASVRIKYKTGKGFALVSENE